MLTNRALKSFDRQHGAYLVLAWPDGLAAPTDLADGEERAATPAEHLAALRAAAPIVREYALVHLATQTLMAPRPGLPTPPPPQPWLLAQLVTPRFVRASRPGASAPAVWSEIVRGERDR